LGIAWVDLDPPYGVLQHKDLKAFAQRIVSRSADAIVRGDTADYDPLYPFFPKNTS
jgi:hypothetical protein